MSNTSQKKSYCPNCGSTAIEQHVASGASICTDCGVVVEENAIVSSVEFFEGADGQSSMMGQYVGANATKPFSSLCSGGNRYGFSRDSRETTLASGRRRVQDVALKLKLGSHFVDVAHRFFTIAVEKNFVQGRRRTHVVAACLYITCRQEKSQHMLIDFSDVLQVNVYTLGACFLKFRRLLGLRLEIIDPALYVYRFAAHLNLNEKANVVSLTALRLVSRMNRDWIVSGRRPAGICAAALLIAARAHGFTRKSEDVTKILRVCGVTVRNRVKDFENTPSANLTLEQFKTIDVKSESDPPVFTLNRIHEARSVAIEKNNIELLSSGRLDNPREYGSKRASRWRNATKLSNKKKDLRTLYTDLQMKISDEENIGNKSLSKYFKEYKDIPVQNKFPPTDTDSLPVNYHNVEPDLFQSGSGVFITKKSSKESRTIIPVSSEATKEELRKSIQPEEDRIYLETWMSEMPDKCVSEMEELFRNDKEVRQKEAIFNKLNKEFIEKQEKKESDKVALEYLRKEENDIDAVQEEDKMRYLKKRSKNLNNSDSEKNRNNLLNNNLATKDFVLTTISARKVSRKINYDALSAIFDELGSFSTDLLEDHGS